MTRKRVTPAPAPVDEDKVGDYRHADATRTNIQEAGLATQDRTPTDRVTYAYDPHLDPQLVWAGKAEHTSFDVDTVSLGEWRYAKLHSTHDLVSVLGDDPGPEADHEARA